MRAGLGRDLSLWRVIRWRWRSMPLAQIIQTWRPFTTCRAACL